MKRVVVTGLGALTPIGNNNEKFWAAVKEGVCGVGEITRIDTSEMKCHIAAELKDFNAEEYIEKKELRKMDLYTVYTVVAASEAFENAKIKMEDEDPWRVGIITGTGIGGMETFSQQQNTLMEKGPSKVSPFFVPMMISNIGAAQVAIKYGMRGVNYNLASACASGSHAIGDAMRQIQHGSCDICLAGGAEAAITPLAIAGFSNMKALSTRNDDPKTASRPFDAERDGFVMGEGAGFLVLEELEHAKKRGAEIICELVGYGATDDAYHITSPIPGGEGGAKAMSLAIEDAGISPCEVDYINAHGTSTKYNDSFETSAIKSVFGDHAYKLAVSSTKSMTGHLLGAAGGIEAIVCAMSLKEGYIPATINYRNADPECDLDIVPNKGRSADIKYAMSNSLGFGGHNATLLFKKYSD